MQYDGDDGADGGHQTAPAMGMQISARSFGGSGVSKSFIWQLSLP
jgi:hypothetical protein